ncbi:ATP-binding cassette domain-containing protein, partial [Bifidobacterium longum]|uniref:ATP-binding cassette domain-containing protein n=1 Tax=Bifidobacterium longum TaxID=216816 RepID=UPI000E3B1D5B
MTTNDITSVAPVVRKAADGSVIPAVEAVQVHKAFGSLHVLKGIDLTVMPGTVTVILGPSGSGKSTFLRLINQLETLTGGSIEVDGELIGYKHVTKNGQDMLQTLDDKEIAAQRSRLGMVFQRFNLFPHMTALENVMEAPIHVQHQSKKAACDLAVAELQRVGLGDRMDYYP